MILMSRSTAADKNQVFKFDTDFIIVALKCFLITLSKNGKKPWTQEDNTFGDIGTKPFKFEYEVTGDNSRKV